MSEPELAAVCRIAQEHWCGGGRRSLANLLHDTRYAAVRPRLNEAGLAEYVGRYPEVAEKWLEYSENKRTSGGWYLVRTGRNWVVGRLDARCRRTDELSYAGGPTACAAYILRELDFWMTVASNRVSTRARLIGTGSGLLVVVVIVLVSQYHLRYTASLASQAYLGLAPADFKSYIYQFVLEVLVILAAGVGMYRWTIRALSR